MANVFTKKTHKPKSTTLSDYRSFDPMKTLTLPRILSPTRVGNPHPLGLNYQINQKKSIFSIWNPDFNRIARKMPQMLDHLRWVNFSCGPISIHKKEPGKPPYIQYTDTTTSRFSYKDRNTFPGLTVKPRTTRYGYSIRNPVKGIVPNMTLLEESNTCKRDLSPENRPASPSLGQIVTGKMDSKTGIQFNKMDDSFTSCTNQSLKNRPNCHYTRKQTAEENFSENSNSSVDGKLATIKTKDLLQRPCEKFINSQNLDILIIDTNKPIQPVVSRKKGDNSVRRITTAEKKTHVPVIPRQFSPSPTHTVTKADDAPKRKMVKISRRVVIPKRATKLIVVGS